MFQVSVQIFYLKFFIPRQNVALYFQTRFINKELKWDWLLMFISHTCSILGKPIYYKRELKNVTVWNSGLLLTF